MVKKFIFWIIIFQSTFFVGCSRVTIKRFTEQRQQMGTFVNIQVLAPSDKEKKVQEAMNSAFKKVDELEQKTSRFLENSDPSKIEKLKLNEILKVSSQSWECFKIADEINKKTFGFYDITAGPLVDIWGFGRKDKKEVPSENQINLALKITGWEKICLLGNLQAVSTTVSGVQIDFSSVAKGLAADIAVETLLKVGFTNLLVNAGGEIRTSSSGEKVWQVGIQIPDEETLKSQYFKNKIIKLKNSAVATSGSYLNYFKRGTNNYSHIINPKTGRPAQTETVSVTVFAKECALADAWATGLFMLPANEAIKIAEKNSKIECLIIERPLHGEKFFRFHSTKDGSVTVKRVKISGMLSTVMVPP